MPFAKNAQHLIEYLQLTGTDTPHTLITGGTQTGKTTLGRFVAALAAAWGAIVVVLDPKWRWKKIFKGLPNVVVYDDPEEWHTVMLSLREEMQRRYMIDQASDGDLLADDGLFPTVVVVADEFASLLLESDVWWRDQVDVDDPKGKAKNKGPAPIRNMWTSLLLRGAEARMVAVGITQQANRNVFPNGTQDRGQYGQRIGLGVDLEPTSWTMLAGPGVVRPPVPPRRRGAGAYIRNGEVVQIQAVKADTEQLRALARRGVALLRAHGHLDASGRLSLHDLPGVHLPRPADIGAPVRDTRPPPFLPPRAAPQAPSPGPKDLAPDHMPSDGGLSDDAVDMLRVIGIAAAVEYLNEAEATKYTAVSFEKARRRRRIEGEETVAGRPCWTRLVLRQWHRSRPIAGRKKSA
ncbi:hypothetical protein [Pseudonocardia sp. ICBG601]|uniref:hypothetical protein n=1 Tax=Pseudonocardia sp. ICBG601 TaxID=2846759 RepID=UPI0027E26105|nr:hypothetical protein [Pseudonocardia sp. ICBG601]